MTRDFADTTYLDFLASAAAIAPVLEHAAEQPVGQTILDAVRATRRVTSANTNLGIILLLAPLARAGSVSDWRTGVSEVLADLTVEDARLAYQAIRLAKPGGLGQASEQDVHQEPTQTLREVMALAGDRDLIARQYANDYREVFDEGLPALQEGLSRAGELEGAIILCHLHWLAHHPDSLIVRKRGLAVAQEAQRRARQAWNDYPEGLRELDDWLRGDGHARNPGTSADLTAACLFAALRLGIMRLPLPIPWSLSPPSA